MKILYIHQHFATPQGSTGTRSYEFARRWVKAGHQVTVITGRYDIGGLKVEKGLINTQDIDGIKVVTVGAKYSNKHPFFKRIMSFVLFMFLCVYVGLRTKKVDVIYATSTPLTIGIPAMLLKFFKRIPYVFEVRDQWPEIPIEMGIIKNKVLIKLLLWLEKAIYNRSSAIVALSPGMADGVRSVLKKEKNITIVPNCSDIERFRPEIDGSKIRNEHKWDDKFVILHAGAMGKANGLEFVVDVAGKLKPYEDIHFVLIGDGQNKDSLKNMASETGCDNIEFISSAPKVNLPYYFAAADLLMVIFANYPVLQHNSANKFFDSLCAGKPVLLNYSGWQREIIEKADAGFGCSLYDAEEFAQRILYLRSNRELLAVLGRNARNLAETQFNRDDSSGRVLSVLESVLSAAK